MVKCRTKVKDNNNLNTQVIYDYKLLLLHIKNIIFSENQIELPQLC
jgi:hypothetical protein